MKYWVVSILTALIACFFGNLSTQVLASNFIFHRNLRRLGKGNRFISNFRRIYGIPGAAKVLLVEVVKDLIPILIGGFLFGRVGYAEVGRVMAGLLMCLCRMYPWMYGFRGGNAAAAFIITCLFVDPSAGIAGLVVLAAGVFISKHLSVGLIAAAVIDAAVGVLVVDNKLNQKMLFILCALMILHALPALRRVLKGQEEAISLKQDLMYKFDE
ncbi:MAG: glycerol-3-phosphate acyltransferase [Oscillospiraceae bacterium]|nr:glycerol-3-phosphate acyltransferase [Oscillospiraceae bacterium]